MRSGGKRSRSGKNASSVSDQYWVASLQTTKGSTLSLNTRRRIVIKLDTEAIASSGARWVCTKAHRDKPKAALARQTCVLALLKPSGARCAGTADVVGSAGDIRMPGANLGGRTKPDRTAHSTWYQTDRS